LGVWVEGGNVLMCPFVQIKVDLPMNIEMI